MKLVEQVYIDSFNAIFDDLLNKVKSNYYNKDDIIGLLDTLYQNEGSSLSGKSEIQNAKLSAAIAAYQAILAKLEIQIIF